MTDRFTIRVCNPSEYEGRINIECNDWYRSGDDYPSFAVPAWDERGLLELCGPFASVDDARRVLCEDAEYLEWNGYTVAA